MSSAKKPANRPPATPLRPQPRVGMVLHRERLYAMIDARQPGAVWFHGPTGAGKTVLLRSYLGRTQEPVLWITVDDRHREPAAWFAAVSAGARPLCDGPLPPFSPEHRDDPAVFARDYFDRLDQLLPPNCALVVDDAHHLADECAPLLARAVEAFDDRRHIFIASQLMPGPAFASLLARSKLWTIGHKLLAFDDHEAVGLARCLGSEPVSLEGLVEATDGWAAGLMLAMQLGAGDKPFGASNDPLESIRTPLALLIAGQVLRGVADDDLGRLRLFAELPQVPTNLGDGAAAWSASCDQLQRLADRGLFVERLAAERPGRAANDATASTGNVARLPRACWRLHDLFRSALRDSAPARGHDPRLAEDLARRLLAVERLDLAWQLAARLDARLLQSVVGTHGSAALRDDHLTALLPMAARHAGRAMPDVAIWVARGLIGVDNAAALQRCDEAFAGYTERADAAGRSLAAALALFVVFATIENASEAGGWIARFADAASGARAADERADHRALRLAGFVAYSLLAGVDAGGADANRAAQDDLLALVADEVLSANETLLAGLLLIVAMRRAIRVAEAELAILRVEALPSCRSAAPHLRASWDIENGFHFTRVGNYERARRCFAEAIGIADANSLAQPRIGALIGLARLEIGLGDADEAEKLVDLLEALPGERLGPQRGWVVHLRARVEALRGRIAQALEALDLADRLIAASGVTRLTGAILGQDRLQLLYASGRVDESLALASRVAAESSEPDARRVELSRDLLAVHARRTDDPARAVAALRAKLPIAESMHAVTMLPLLPDVVAELAAMALENGICTEFAARVVEWRRLRAPRPVAALWPCPVRVEVLRPFRIVVGRQPLVFTGKTQQKPLELLKFLACARDLVAESTHVAAALWPDGDEAAGKKSLEVTVSRLRRLLGDETLVVVRDGKVALDARRVSSDAGDLARATLRAEAVGAGGMPGAEVEAIGARLLSLFVAIPLEEEEATAWREAVRERYRAAFVRAARTLIAYWVDAGQPARATTLIEAALAREPLAENLYRTLMQIHLDHGHPTEAMRVYRQCRQMLSVLIGAQPSHETERLKEEIHF